MRSNHRSFKKEKRISEVDSEDKDNDKQDLGEDEDGNDSGAADDECGDGG